MEPPIYISSITVRDFRGISRFSAKLGMISIVIGENGIGKTSLIESIAGIFEGGSDPDDVRNGAEEAEIILELSDGTQARKIVKRSGYDLQVRTAEGGSVKAPATWLKSLAPGLSFDPIEFLSKDPKERAAFLLKTLPLTFEADEVNAAIGIPTVPAGSVSLQRINEIRQGKYDERTALNQTIRDLQGTIADMQKSIPADDDKDWGAERDRLAFDVAGVDGEVQRLAAEIELEAEQARTEKRYAARNEIARLNALIREAEEKLDKEVRTIDTVAAQCLAEQTTELKNRQASLSLELGTARAKADQQQQAAGIRKAIEERKRSAEGYTLKEIRLTNAIKSIDDLKHRKLKDLPIEGLDISADTRGRPVIKIDGVPLDKLNRQQQLYIATQAVTLASGRLPMVICETAELDDDHLGEIAEAARSGGIQVVLARWVNGSPLRVVDLNEYRKSKQSTKGPDETE